MIVRAVVHKAEEGGYWAEVPAIPGCVTQAHSLEALEANLREAIEGCLSASEPLPDSGETVDTIEIRL